MKRLYCEKGIYYPANEKVKKEWLVLATMEDKAKELLMQGVNRIDRIAKMVGYLDARALTRAFTRLYGLTPSQYKEIASIESDCEQND